MIITGIKSPIISVFSTRTSKYTETLTFGSEYHERIDHIIFCVSADIKYLIFIL